MTTPHPVSSPPIDDSLDRRKERVTPLVSITVPTYNNARTIGRCIDSLLSQEGANVEIIVVDDGSTDGTSEVVKNLMKSHQNLKLVSTHHSGPSHARNTGFEESGGQVLLFADGDAYYAGNYVSKSLSVIEEDPSVGGVCVTGTIWIVKSTFVSRGIAIEYELKQDFLRTGKWQPYFAFLYTRKALEKTGGYDESLFQGEDKDLFNRVKEAGFRIGLVQGFNWFHQYPQDISSLLKRSYRGGKQRVIYVVKRRMYREFLRGTIGIWALAAGLAAAPFVPIVLPALAASFALVYTYRACLAFTRGSGKGKASDLLLLPTLSAIRYLATAAGYSKGAMVYLTRTATHRQTGWADV